MEAIQILIIDDNSDDRDMYTRFLDKEDSFVFEYHHANSGKEGVKLFDSQKIDCIILDYSLPDMDGLEVIEELRKSEQEELLPIIAITGSMDPEVAAELVFSGAKEYLIKDNVSSDALVKAIMNAIEKSTLNKKINLQNEEIKKKNLELEFFTKALVHDLKSPIQNIHSLLMILNEKLESDPDMKEYRRSLKSCSTRALKTIESMYTLAGLTEEKMHLETLKLSALIKEVEIILADEIKESDLSIIFDCEDEIYGSADMLIIVMQNLVANSIKFIRAKTKPMIRVKARKESDELLNVYFEDNGEGIPEDQIEKVFTPFYSLNQADNKRGLGLGLNIVKKISDLHDATLTLSKSDDLGGVCFHFSFKIN